MKTIFEQTRLGALTLKNRLVRSATWENMATADGHLTPRLSAIYSELAAGGPGLLITGYANVVAEEQPNPNMMGIYDDSFIPEYSKLVESVHAHGSRIIMQLAYGGTKTNWNLGERVIFAPSEVPERMTGNVGTVMTVEDIAALTDAYAAAAERAQKAGFDGVEIHGAHGYLLNQFLSPYYNRRQDQYGGTAENRIRFLLEICTAIRRRVGAEFAILVKLTASDFFDGGLTFEETKQTAIALEKVGVDGLEITGNIYLQIKEFAGKTIDGCTLRKEGYFVEYAQKISELVSIPVMTVGGFSRLETLEEVVSTTKIELFALCRPLMTEPQLVKRWQEGDTKRVKCVRCSKCGTLEGNYCTTFNSLK